MEPNFMTSIDTILRRKGTSLHGYRAHKRNGKQVLEHILVVERVLGKPIPTGAIIHHVNERREDNRHENLVLCPDHGYHILLHQRMRAFKACGHYDWRSCRFCHKYDHPDNLKIYPRSIHHADCASKYKAGRKARAFNPIS